MRTSLVTGGRLVLFVLAGLYACSETGEGGCSGCEGLATVPYPAEPPVGGHVQPDVVRARLTQSVLDFLVDHTEALLAGAEFLTIVDGSAQFELPPDVVDPGGPVSFSPGSFIAFDLDRLRQGLTLTWLDDDDQGRPGLRVSMRGFELDLDIQFATHIPELLPDTACRVQSRTETAAVTVAEMAFDMRIQIDGSGPAPTLAATTENITIDLGGTTDDVVFAMTVTPCDGSEPHPDLTCNDPVCAAANANCPEVCGFFDLFAQLGGFLAQILQPAIDALAPDIAGVISTALIDGLAAIPLGIETQFDLRALLGPTFASAQALNLKIAASDQVSTQGGESLGRGLDLGLSGGMTAAAPAGCAAGALPPDFSLLAGGPPDFSGWLELPAPGSGPGGPTRLERYHFVATISQALLTQATWAAFQSGLLCFNLDAYEIESLTGGLLPFNARLLQTFDNRLADIAEPLAPMLVSLRATHPPMIRLGAGRAVSDEVNDPLLEISINDLELGLFMHIDDTQHRISELRADILLKLDLERTPDGAHEMVVQDIVLAEIRQTYNEVVPLSDLSELFELVVDLAVDVFLGDSLRFQLDLSPSISDALGIPLELRINALRRDFGTDNTPFLSLYATLCDLDDLADPDNPACYTETGGGRRATVSPRVRLASDPATYRAADPQRFDPHRWIAAPAGRARLRIDSDGAGPFEHQWRVDGGPWSGFHPTVDGLLEVRSARLYALGLHTIEVRSRIVNDPASRGEAVPVQVWIDPERPVVEAYRDGDRVRITADDLGAPEAIELRVRHVVGDQASTWEAVGTKVAAVDVAGLAGALEVAARDPAGNVSDVAVVWLSQPEPGASPRAQIPRAALGGCAAAGAPWLAVLTISAFALRRARRRRG